MSEMDYKLQEKFASFNMRLRLFNWIKLLRLIFAIMCMCRQMRLSDSASGCEICYQGMKLRDGNCSSTSGESIRHRFLVKCIFCNKLYSWI